MFLRPSSGLSYLLLGLQTLPITVIGASLQLRASTVDWQPCGEGFQCANVSVPLDHHNASDPRTASIAVTRLLATDEKNRKGSVFVNPGGPGGSGTQFAFGYGPALSVVLKGQYDIVGFDPRGVNQTSPHVSCFDSQQDQVAFQAYANNFLINLPGNVSSLGSSIESDVRSQVSQFNSVYLALAAHCHKKTGDALAYMGTEAVVRDIDLLSKKIEGADARINYLGLSYGTIIGQYMVKILHPDRLGRIIIDGIVDPDKWSQYAIDTFNTTILGMSDSFRVFASTCLSAGDNCSLNAYNFSSVNDLLTTIDQMVDALYANTVPIYDLYQPAVATASDLRFTLGSAMYNITMWPLLADSLSLALTGNFTPIVSFARPWLLKNNGDPPENSPYAENVISCDDSRPYDNTRLPPTPDEMTQSVLRKASGFPSWGNQWFLYDLFCHAWEQEPSRSRYNGTFELKNGTLATPMLILSNTVDPVTPLVNAQAALSRLGDNARLIQQVDGYGHCALTVVSYCTLLSIGDYLVNGTVPGDSYTRCEVDQHPWLPFEVVPNLSKRHIAVDDETKAAWRELSEAFGAVVRP